jgi:hypothetical protein
MVINRKQYQKKGVPNLTGLKNENTIQYQFSKSQKREGISENGLDHCLSLFCYFLNLLQNMKG